MSLSLFVPAGAARADVAPPNLVQSATMGSLYGVSGKPVVDSSTHTLFEAVDSSFGTGPSEIREVNDLTGELIRQIPPSRDIFVAESALAVDEATNTVYIASGLFVEAFNAATGAEIFEIQVPDYTYATNVMHLVMDPVTHDLFVGVGTHLYELAGDTGAVVSQVAVPFPITSLAVDTASRLAFISEFDQGLVKVDLSTFTVVATSTQIEVANLAVDHGTGQLFGQVGQYALSLGSFSESSLDRIATPLTGIQDFVVDSSRGFVYVSNAGGTALYELDLSSDTVARTVQMAPSTIFIPQVEDLGTGNLFNTDEQNSDSMIRVLAEPSAITSGAPTKGETWTDYSFSLSMSPTGVFWSLISGTLPPGLTLDATTGVLSGTPTTVGSYTYTVTGRDATGAGSTATYTQLIGLNRVVAQVFGPDRYQTSVEAAKEAFPDGADVVFVADGNNFPDALSAGPAATKLGAPVLLTAPDSLPAAVAREIGSLAPSKIVVVGGTGSVSNSVAAQLAQLVPNTVRWAGADRYATSRAVDSNAFGSDIPNVFVASGNNFPDGLSAGAAAGALGAPLLLVNGSAGALDAASAGFLERSGVSFAYIAGGTGAVSSGVENGLYNSVFGGVSRFAGSDRYQTAEKINEAVWNADGTNTSEPGSNLAFLVNGLNFPDALSAGPWAGGTNAPMYLVPPTCVPNKVISDLNGLGVSFVVLVGGPGVLTQPVAELKPCNPSESVAIDEFAPPGGSSHQAPPPLDVAGHAKRPRQPSVG
ncbi:cell wall-binding repeat-containing protein [Diaminobutyricibacter sp. McL0618]|uniref:cell wall-binding repeat-containing protein n=1 Tax=Leifsonia sp. McL0618 TaxID=3415677 RepID=UPI003CE83395